MLTLRSLAMPSITPNLRNYLKVVTLFWRWENSTPCNDKKRVEVLPRKIIDEDHYRCGEGPHPQGPCWFQEFFSMSGLGNTIDVLLDEGVDALTAISVVADLHGVAMVAEMNADRLCDVIVVDLEDFGMA